MKTIKDDIDHDSEDKDKEGVIFSSSENFL